MMKDKRTFRRSPGWYGVALIAAVVFVYSLGLASGAITADIGPFAVVCLAFVVFGAFVSSRGAWRRWVLLLCSSVCLGLGGFIVFGSDVGHTSAILSLSVCAAFIFLVAAYLVGRGWS
jgi:hypothetical protein